MSVHIDVICTHLQVAFPSSTTQTPSFRHSTFRQASGISGVVLGVGRGWLTVRLEMSEDRERETGGQQGNNRMSQEDEYIDTYDL